MQGREGKPGRLQHCGTHIKGWSHSIRATELQRRDRTFVLLAQPRLESGFTLAPRPPRPPRPLGVPGALCGCELSLAVLVAHSQSCPLLLSFRSAPCGFLLSNAVAVESSRLVGNWKLSTSGRAAVLVLRSWRGRLLRVRFLFA